MLRNRCIRCDWLLGFTSIHSHLEKSDIRFKEKVALVTGGGGGIGSATVERLASEGAMFYLMYRDADHASQTQDLLNAKGIPVQSFVGDVTVFADLERACSQIETDKGGVDIVFNVAGRQPHWVRRRTRSGRLGETLRVESQEHS